jgi:hypothetical protein
VSDGSIFQIPGPGVTNAFWNNLGDTFNGATGTPNDPTHLNLNRLDIESTLTVGGDPTLAGGTNLDFMPGSGVIIANGSRDPNGNWVVSGGTRAVHCAKVVRVTPAGLGGVVEIDTQLPSPPFVSGATGTMLTAVPAIIYEVTHPIAGDFSQTLLSRNSVGISDQIEDLQVQFWVDSSPTNGSIETTEWPLNNLDDKDTSRIRRVRIYALGRTRIPDAAGGTEFARHHHPGMANQPPGPTYDAFQREVFVASVLPRNLFDYLENPNAIPANVP